ncbi:MAG: hypothetical protein A2445_01360 [Candidatus Jacksonbacteria bacterium RIFOXYC2_FULL_44_29]|nr:MAG: hypothetical protein UW45_C0013G0036 [Parcubacteria group bacterium GW2011_GWC2_44_22]OGY76538.1 MAG: hypothetical protein A2295_02175 [Candidatus Jacksonbacteria bacterium RIFOXYB2_FULL_44_15]OGY76552.1 MAG: hypothetical protein A2240_03800 [Candidatus Jacksonbacteria bacterium RIFOXYA2_FULL_43_12]OGY78518.1 MAG: hypothetical protein A2445_01360 [Candidatus Jacksonbacteria bacterium RIFOXYC2_FULL_44_29]OGY81175.1 MAG: hypothetical protein A2550_01755 [Candidatus Jacksonbacteria bacteri
MLEKFTSEQESSQKAVYTIAEVITLLQNQGESVFLKTATSKDLSSGIIDLLSKEGIDVVVSLVQDQGYCISKKKDLPES